MEYLALFIAAFVVFIIIYRRHERDDLYRSAQHDRKERRKELIVEYLRHHSQVTNDEIQELFDVSDATATNYLHELVLEGKIHQVGEHGRGVHYVPFQS